MEISKKWKFAGWLLVGASVSAGIGVGIWQLIPSRAATVTYTPLIPASNAENPQPSAAPASAPVTSWPQTQTPARFVEWRRGGQDLDDLDVVYGGLSSDRSLLKNYEYKLTEPYATQEQSMYAPDAVDLQVQNAIRSLNSPLLTYSAKFSNVVQNFVDAFNQNNTDKVVAWRTDQDLAVKGSSEYANIYLEGGPISDAKSDLVDSLRDVGYWRGFYLNEAQFGLVPADVVGKAGSTAATNYYLKKLVSSDQALLAKYRQAYDRGRLNQGALLSAIGGDLDLTAAEIRIASSLATGIVATARVTALTSQLEAENYSRVSITGLSYGMPLGLLTLLLNPALTNSIYAATFGENSMTEASFGTSIPNELDASLNWDRRFFSLRGLVDMLPWINEYLAGQYGDAFRQKVTIHNAKDDEKFPTQWVSEQKYWTGKNVNYKLYATGGHSVWFTDNSAMAALSGLKPGETHYTAKSNWQDSSAGQDPGWYWLTDDWYKRWRNWL